MWKRITALLLVFMFIIEIPVMNFYEGKAYAAAPAIPLLVEGMEALLSIAALGAGFYATTTDNSIDNILNQQDQYIELVEADYRKFFHDILDRGLLDDEPEFKALTESLAGEGSISGERLDALLDAKDLEKDSCKTTGQSNGDDNKKKKIDATGALLDMFGDIFSGVIDNLGEQLAEESGQGEIIKNNNGTYRYKGNYVINVFSCVKNGYYSSTWGYMSYFIAHQHCFDYDFTADYKICFYLTPDSNSFSHYDYLVGLCDKDNKIQALDDAVIEDDIKIADNYVKRQYYYSIKDIISGTPECTDFVTGGYPGYGSFKVTDIENVDIRNKLDKIKDDISSGFPYSYINLNDWSDFGFMIFDSKQHAETYLLTGATEGLLNRDFFADFSFNNTLINNYFTENYNYITYNNDINNYTTNNSNSFFTENHYLLSQDMDDTIRNVIVPASQTVINNYSMDTDIDQDYINTVVIPTIVNEINANLNNNTELNLKDLDITQVIDFKGTAGDGTWEDVTFFGLEKKFPFCLPFDLIRFLSILDAEPRAPCITITLPLSIIGMEDYTITFDFSMFDEVAEILRTMELLGSVIGLMFITKKIMS